METFFFFNITCYRPEKTFKFLISADWDKFLVHLCPSRIYINNLLVPPQNLFLPPPPQSRYPGAGPSPGQGYKKIRGQRQGQPFRGQTLSRPRAGMLEKKGFQKFFQAISKRGQQKRSSQILHEVSGIFQQNLNGTKNNAYLEPRTGQFSKTWSFEAKARYLNMCPQGLHLWLIPLFYLSLLTALLATFAASSRVDTGHPRCGRKAPQHNLSINAIRLLWFVSIQ